ncbi:MAG: peptidoglycan editing factor PgeF [Candidatus Doudnabacteria bacterium]|jgi:hypothetical protein
MFKLFKKYPNLKFGLSQKADGPMELGGSVSFPNRKSFFAKSNIQLNQTVCSKLAHSENVVWVNKKNAGTVIQDVDGLVTQDLEVVLTVTVADCYPIYFYDPKKNIIGLIHSGWRGSVSNLIANAINTIGGNPGSLLVGVGPGIGPCHFEIQKDILQKFKEFPNAQGNRCGKIFINLPKIIQIQLTNSGIMSENIEFADDCTYCKRNKYFSYRRDHPTSIQAMVAYISL